MPDNTKTSRLFRLLLCLLNSYPKTQEEINEFLQIKKSAFYKYRNELMSFGFEVRQKEGRCETKAPIICPAGATPSKIQGNQFII